MVVRHSYLNIKSLVVHLRQHPFHVKAGEVKMHLLSVPSVEEVRAFRVTRVRPGGVWRRKCTVSGLSTVVHERAGKLFQLFPRCYSEIWKIGNELLYLLLLHSAI